jgi:hypothetical protein
MLELTCFYKLANRKTLCITSALPILTIYQKESQQNNSQIILGEDKQEGKNPHPSGSPRRWLPRAGQNPVQQEAVQKLWLWLAEAQVV